MALFIWMFPAWRPVRQKKLNMTATNHLSASTKSSFTANLPRSPRRGTCSTNSLNQSQVEWRRHEPADSGTLDVMGTALSTASVSVNGQSASRKGGYFDAAVPVNNGTTNVYQTITNSITDGVTTFTTNGNLF